MFAQPNKSMTAIVKLPAFHGYPHSLAIRAFLSRDMPLKDASVGVRGIDSRYGASVHTGIVFILRAI